MRDFVVRTNDKRFERVARIESERVSCRFRLRRRLLKRGRLFSHLHGRSRRRGKFYRARRTESGDDRCLQRAHMITLNPKLIDVIWNAERERGFGGVNQFNSGKPALE